MNLKIEPIEQYEDLRSAFIHKFICQTSVEYYEHIEKISFENGLPYYKGFLWEFFYHNQLDRANSVLITEEAGLHLLNTKNNIMFMFDYFNYTNERQHPKLDVFNRHDWQHIIYRTQANCISRLIWNSWNENQSEINRTLNSPVALPDCVYIFDETLTWHLAFTCENIGQERICFKYEQGADLQ